uniref:Synaptobrevin, longin-like domain protein n=1 Tax=Tanacetum cinerariifolium TaxID=118510 RepID=A0A6L2N7U0_TANCI|nr:hypothetical protein [Tanacetum cinerariifolium]
MPSLFADTHNVVAILEKSYAAEGFDQIIDFLSGSYIYYALTVNPHIYISCIKQFWNTASVKRSGDVTRLQALVDKKKILISEAVIREILQLDDAEGVVCLPNEEIFSGLAQMGYEKLSTKLTFYKAFFSNQWKFLIHTILQSLSAKRTSWNEFSTAMASVVICLSKGQRFNFSKYIFNSLVRNVDSSSKFYMVGKGFSGVETPLFKEDVEEHVAKDVSHCAIPLPPSHDISPPTQEPSLPHQQPHLTPPAPTQGEALPANFQQVLDTCSTLIRRVEHLERDNVAQKLDIIKLKSRVKKLEQSNKVKSSKFKRLRKVRTSRRVESSNDMEDVFNQGRMIADMDMNEGIELVKDVEVAESEGRHATKQAEKQAKIYHIDLDHPLKVLSIHEDDSEVQEVVEFATIPAAKLSIPAAAPTAVAAYIRRRKGVIIIDPEEELPLKTSAETPKVNDKGKGILVESPKPMKKKDQIELDAKYARKLHEEINKDDAEFNKDIDWDAAMDHVNQQSSKNPQYIKRYHGMKKKSQTESEARKNMMIYLKNIVGYKMDFFKGMLYADICPIFQARFDENIRFLFKSREEMEAEDEEIIKSINETPAQKAAKRRKLNEEAQEAEAQRSSWR